jgi:protoporphyrinogen/coproporphyrinogen III oxidase
VKVVVIGGGVAGLAAGLRLIEAGHDVQVIEAAQPGGVVATRWEDGFLHEHAANGFLAAPDGAAALCDELGVELVGAAKAARNRWIYIDGALRKVPASPLGLIRTDLLTWRGKLDLLKEPLRPARDVDRAGDESVHAFAARRFGPEVARAVVAPFVTGVFAADAHDVSLAAGFPKLAALDRGGGVVRGLVRGLRNRTRGGRRGLLAPRDGMGALVGALVGALGTRLVTGTVVRAVTGDDRGASIVLATGSQACDAAVIATPARHAAELVTTGVPELAPRLAELRRAPSAVVFLGFPAAAVRAQHELDGFGFLVAMGEELRMLGAVFESVVWPGRAPDDAVLIRCIFGGARDPDAARLEDAALIAQARADLERALGITVPPIHTAIARTADGIAPYPIGHRDRVATLDSLAGQHRLVLAGADYHGIGINDVIADARRVVKEVGAWA